MFSSSLALSVWVSGDFCALSDSTWVMSSTDFGVLLSALISAPSPFSEPPFPLSLSAKPVIIISPVLFVSFDVLIFLLLVRALSFPHLRGGVFSKGCWVFFEDAQVLSIDFGVSEATWLFRDISEVTGDLSSFCGSWLLSWELWCLGETLSSFSITLLLV